MYPIHTRATYIKHCAARTLRGRWLPAWSRLQCVPDRRARVVFRLKFDLFIQNEIVFALMQDGLMWAARGQFRNCGAPHKSSAGGVAQVGFVSERKQRQRTAGANSPRTCCNAPTARASRARRRCGSLYKFDEISTSMKQSMGAFVARVIGGSGVAPHAQCLWE